MEKVDDGMKCNYEAFGDVFASDATYGTNMYNMIFVPFTRVDHHKRCVTFGAGLLYDETIESYKWLLSRFLDTHKKHHLLVLTNQDAAMKQAVANVFNESIHRLCLWHIIRKLPAKMKRLATGANGVDHGPSAAGANGFHSVPSADGSNGVDPGPSTTGP
ncbi:hypothetical protein QVD17_41435 [Tagetes erecta]|uniref:MULE transposase domain-containing protein n=1 Tax=Tagetes erecta TaxID=13708 RepID=A0AAD8JLT5_TARER|nr:hypothetical protein QVD17_41435 [Tagetes erecta]